MGRDQYIKRIQFEWSPDFLYRLYGISVGMGCHHHTNIVSILRVFRIFDVLAEISVQSLYTAAVQSRSKVAFH